MANSRRNSISGSNSSTARRRSNSLAQKKKRSSVNLTKKAKRPTKTTARINRMFLRRKLGARVLDTINSEVIGTSSIDPKGYRTSFWQTKDGPSVFIDNLTGTGEGTIREIKDDFYQIKTTGDIYKNDNNPLPIDIYINPAAGLDINNIADRFNTELNPPDGKQYIPLDDGSDGQPIRLLLMDPPPPVPEERQDNVELEDNNAVVQQPVPPNIQQQVLPPQAPQQAAAQPAAIRIPPIPGPRLEQMPNRRVPDVNAFIQNMGRAPIADDTLAGRTIKKHDKIYKSINDKLTSYLQAVNTALARPDTIDQDTLDADNQTIQQLKDALITEAHAYSENNKSKTQQEGFAIIDLVAKITGDNLGGTNAELSVRKSNIEKIQDVRRRRDFINTLSPLRDVHLDRTQQGRVLGEGAQGEVRSFFLRLPDGRTIEAGRKFDNAEASDAAGGIGIPRDKPDEAKRAVATSEASQFLGLNIVPLTALYYGRNPKTNRDEVGQIMQVVNGVDGSKKVRLGQITDPAEIQKRLDIKAKYDQDPKSLVITEPATFANTIYQRNAQGVLEVFDAETRPVDIDYMSPIVQKELADQQLLDIFVGHADRHGGNWIYQRDDQGNITGVRALDNDDTWGRLWEGMTGRFDNSKTPGDPPPIVDIQSAANILRADPDNIPASIQAKLSPAEIDAAKTRLIDLQTKIKDRLINGRFAKLSEATLSDSDQQFLQQQVGNQNMLDFNNVKEWGLVDTFIYFLPKKGQNGDPPPINDSYLAEALTLKANRGVAPI